MSRAHLHAEMSSLRGAGCVITRALRSRTYVVDGVGTRPALPLTMTEAEWQDRYEITSTKGRIWKRSEIAKPGW